MKPVKKITKSLATAALLTALAINFNACSQNDAPLSTQTEVSENRAVNIINFAKTESSPSLKKVTETSKFVKANRGGTLYLYHYNGNNDLEAEISLKIPANSMSEDAEVKLTLDDEQFLGNLDIVFSPHGVTFSQPAILNIWAYGLDMSDVNPNDADIYYDNEEAAQWELMPRDNFWLEVDGGIGEVEVTNARLPHFSRYAVAWSN